MAWQHTHTVTVKDLNRDQIWQLWQDVNNWHIWDKDLEYARLQEAFATGSRFLLRPKGGPNVKIQLHKVEPGKGFTDLTRFPLARMYGIHEMKDTPAGLEISHTMRVEGPLSFLWQKIVVEKIASGLEAQTRDMLAHARRKKS